MKSINLNIIIMQTYTGLCVISGYALQNRYSDKRFNVRQQTEEWLNFLTRADGVPSVEHRQVTDAL